ncbi:hypothetical protein HD594_000310 [Microbacterium thalassium]|uniref:PLD phosphodiesterase domain-containing protein n=1 Tax=Microbacterium thalassium TaxID=362649 RepID=A0A7X0FM22_9MICO|nr:hypothetical protein [Microbacterium thalassium]GLK24683.1 hypothetical protein GCM10017607_20010 [Microbacterium thalassium]
MFTPYFDRMLARLLGNATLDASRLSVVTDLSPDTGALNYRGQLIGARLLLRRGVEVRSLPRLHAKVLVCDGAQVTVGSQNFTTYGRGSKETTAVIADDVTGTDFTSTLDEWYVASTPVSLEFVEHLLSELVDQTAAVVEAQLRLAEAFDEQWIAYLDRLEEERREREAALARRPMALQLARAVRRSAERQARSSVWARLSLAGEYDNYETLKANPDSTLTRWATRNPRGDTSLTTLRRLHFYPIVLNPSGRMAFGRVAQTRITYVRSSVKWTRPREIFGGRYNLTVRFPEEGLEAANIQMTLTVSGQVECASLELRLRFDGLALALASASIDGASRTGAYFGRYRQSQIETLEALVSQLEEPDTLGELFRSAFGSFTYSELGVGNRNADDYFPHGWVRIALIDYSDCPVLVVTPHRS